MIKYFYGQKSRKKKIEEIERIKRDLRIKCNIASIATRDKWYSDKLEELNAPELEIISKEEVLEEIELIKKLEANLKNI